jgi:hypothetical protein
MWCILSFFFVTFCDCEEWLGHFPLSDEAISMCAKSPERDSESKSAWNSRVGPVAVNLEDSPVINGAQRPDREIRCGKSSISALFHDRGRYRKLVLCGESDYWTVLSSIYPSGSDLL